MSVDPPATTRHLADLDGLVARFEAGTLPWAEWRHAEHLLVCLVYHLRETPEAATTRLRAAIPRYNAAHGVATTPDRGYHETLTRFWSWAVGAFLAGEAAGLPRERLAERMLAALLDKRLPLRHYSHERLFSAEARFGWVPPDRRPLDGLD